MRADNHERRARRELAKGTGGKARIESKTQAGVLTYLRLGDRS